MQGAYFCCAPVSYESEELLYGMIHESFGLGAHVLVASSGVTGIALGFYCLSSEENEGGNL